MSDEIEFTVSIEKIAERVGSTSHDDRSIEENISHAENINEKVSLLKKLAENIGRTTVEVAHDTSTTTSPPPKIQKAPFILRGREKFKKHYEPRVVSVGPIHHGKENLRMAEQYKYRLAATFTKDSGQEFEALYKIIYDNVHELKKYFDKEALECYDDNTLSWILFLDGCAVLQFIRSLFRYQLEDFKIKNDHIALMQLDFLLLENQIPFEVLRKLMNSSKFRTQYRESIESFILANVMAPVECTEQLIFDVDDLDPIHLLDFLQEVARLDTNKNKSKIQKKKGKIVRTWTKRPPHSFCNIQELKAASIDLKPSESCSLADITFSSFWFSGRLHLPPLIVDDSTAPKFLNLIAYKCCPDNYKTNYEVTTYIRFLNRLIDHAIDVKELRSAKILHDLLGSDEEVVSMFHGIATDLVPYLEHYADVKIGIQRYFDSGWMRITELYHAYFSGLAFSGGIFVLLLTAIQT